MTWGTPKMIRGTDGRALPVRHIKGPARLLLRAPVFTNKIVIPPKLEHGGWSISEGAPCGYAFTM
jgi:hypothetical protein